MSVRYTHGGAPMPPPGRRPRRSRAWMAAAVVVVLLVAGARALQAARQPAHSTPASAVVAAASSSNDWKLVATDDFNGTALNQSAWTTYTGTPGGVSAGTWASSHVVVRDGLLVIRAYRDPAYRNALVTGGLSSAKGLSQTYGKYLVRMRVDAGRGVSWVALLWPVAHHWPPEVDLGEDNGAGDRRTLTATQHYTTPTTHDAQVGHKTRVDMTQWHTVGVEWSPGLLSYTIDGQIWATTANPYVPSEPMALDLQTQAWGCVPGRWEQCADSSTPAEVDMDVDWVAAYARAG